MAVVTLLGLENERPLPLERRAPRQILRRDRLAAPCVHCRTPRRMDGQMREGPERDRQEQNGEHRDRAPPPALFSFARNERKRDQHRSATAGPISNAGVSIEGGSNESTA